MTDLSLHEISELEKKVRANYLKNRKRKIIFIISVSLVFLFLFVLLISNRNSSIKNSKGISLFSDQFDNTLIFSENFTSNKNNWPIYNDFKYERYFKDGNYIFTSNKKDSCFEDIINLKLPKGFTAEVTSTWLGGRYEPYGIKFRATFDEYARFLAFLPENKVGYIKDDTKQHDKRWHVHKNEQENIHHKSLKLKVKPRPWSGDPRVRTIDIDYWVNGNYVDYLIIDDLGTWAIKHDRNLKSFLSIAVCGCQSVSFEKIKISDNRTGKQIFNGSFEELKDYLHPGKEILKYSKIENGAYLFETNNQNKNNKCTLKKVLKDKSKISLTSSRLSGENNYYGIILEQDSLNYYTFDLKPDGRASFTTYVNGIETVFTDNLETGLQTVSDTSIVQTVLLKGKSLEYFVNDRLILTENHQIKPLQYIGFRISGDQKVAFETLQVWE
jgi:hypothetical protein